MKQRTKVWKKTLTTRIVNIPARTSRARHYKHASMKYMSYKHIYFLSVTFKRINIFIIDIRINYKHFHSKNMTREEKRDDYAKKAKNPGGGLLLNPLTFFLSCLRAYDYVRWKALVWIDISCLCCEWISLLKKIL